MTTWADVVAAGLIQIDDVRLEEQMAVSPAQFFRRMSAIIKQATPLLSRPPELLSYITNGEVVSTFDDYEWQSTEASVEAPVTLETGKIGYDLCSVTVRIENPNGTISILPYTGATYNAATGEVSMPQQSDSGINYDFDFYTDGTFPDLTPSQLRLFALAIAVVWDERFSRTWLNLQMKIKDESFSTVNEANYAEKITRRLHDNRIAFNDELRWYEQLCAYHNAFKNQNHATTLI